MASQNTTNKLCRIENDVEWTTKEKKPNHVGVVNRGAAAAGAGAVNDKRGIAGEDPISRFSLNAA